MLAIAGPIISIPQIITLYGTRAAEGFYLPTWIIFGVFNIPWIIYGFVHKDKPIIINTMLWFISNVAMVVGIILYS